VVNERVSDKLSGGPKQGKGNQQNRDISRGSNTGKGTHGGDPRSAGLDRGRNIRPFGDEVMDSAVSGRAPLKEPERQGNVYDPEHPTPDRNPPV
jgi:hypothetical protein